MTDEQLNEYTARAHAILRNSRDSEARLMAFSCDDLVAEIRRLNDEIADRNKPTTQNSESEP